MKPEELYPYIEKNQPNICQISVLQNGQEPCAYFTGSGIFCCPGT